MAGYNSTGVFTASICEKMLINLADITSSGNLPMARRSYLGFVDYLKSTLNTGGTEVIPIQAGDKHKQVRIKYGQRAVVSEIQEAEDGDCIPSRYPDFLETTFDVTRIVSTDFGLNRRQIALICDENNTEMLMETLFSYFDAITQKLDNRLLTIMSLNVGYNYGNTPASASAKSVNVLVAATGAPLATGIQIIDQDYYEKNQYVGTGAIIGAGNIIKYWKTITTGCCNQDGVDMGAYAAQYGWAPFLDTQIESVFGANKFLVVAPGMLQLVTWNRYVGSNYGVFGSATDTLITDPRTGITYDMKVFENGCDEKVYVRLTLNYDLWYEPTDVFNPEDPLYRTNGVTLYTAATT